MTLALLLTAVTGAWATTDVYLVGNGDGNWLNGVGWDPGAAGNKMTEQNGVYSITFTNVAANSELQFKFAINGTWDENYGCTSDTENELNKTLSNIELFGTNIMFGLTETADVTISFNLSEKTYMISTKGMKVGDDASSGPTVAWDASTKTGTFKMPGSDVVLTPIYAKAAAFATTGTEPDVKTQLPEAAEGVIAGTDASLIAEGTGIVAFAGTSAEVKQGTLMYAIGTSATQAPDLTAFSPTVPTAAGYDDAATVYVWYYIKGADTPTGHEATEDNTFNDSEPACLTVTVLTNKFDIQFNAANANTIEAGKATVTVGGTAATVTEGKLQGVKMGREVKMTAKDGYKFRKVEVKKGGGEPVLLTTITAADNSSFKSGSQTFGDVATVTLTGDYLTNDGSHGGWYCQSSNTTATISVAGANGANITSVKFYTAGGGSAEDKDAPFEVTTTTVTSSNITTYLNGNSIGSYGVSKIEVYGTK